MLERSCAGLLLVMAPFVLWGCVGSTNRAARKGRAAEVLALDKEFHTLNACGQCTLGGLATTPLGCAAYAGQVNTMRTLINNGAAIDYNCGGCEYSCGSPLLMAASAGQAAAVKLLLENGAPPDTRDREGRTALDYARRSGSKEAAALIEAALERRR